MYEVLNKLRPACRSLPELALAALTQREMSG